MTDLDNTLYDWVGYFSASFRALFRGLVSMLAIDANELSEEFRAIHRKYGDSEVPFAALELPSVRRSFPDASRRELRELLQPALNAFDEERERTLKLYAGVHETLRTLQERGARIVGHTEASYVNALYRLRRLGIADLFVRLYALEHKGPAPPSLDRHQNPPDSVVVVPHKLRKPNPALLVQILNHEGYKKRECMYVGDSLTRDVSMARSAGVRSVWAKYGNAHNSEDWELLVSVTHWTDDDVRREEELRSQFSEIEPDHTIDNYSEILELAGLV